MNSFTRFSKLFVNSSTSVSKKVTFGETLIKRSVGSWRTTVVSSQDVQNSARKRNFNDVKGMWGTFGGRSIVTSAVIKADAEMVDVTFVRSDGSKITTKGKVGDNLLDVVVNNNVDLDGFGACEGTLACSTCHLVFKKEDFDKIEEKLTDEEMDMLDMAYGLSDTSRLGCQVCLTKKLAGVEVVVPAGVNDARS